MSSVIGIPIKLTLWIYLEKLVMKFGDFRNEIEKLDRWQNLEKLNWWQKLEKLEEIWKLEILKVWTDATIMKNWNIFEKLETNIAAFESV